MTNLMLLDVARGLSPTRRGHRPGKHTVALRCTDLAGQGVTMTFEEAKCLVTARGFTPSVCWEDDYRIYAFSAELDCDGQSQFELIVDKKTGNITTYNRRDDIL